EDITEFPAHRLVYKGIAMVPEGRGVFGKLTVIENLDMGAYHRSDRAAIQADIEWAFELFPRLKER
ncbi:MAG: ABC transporter ATP-binding protein, partial [Gammaproteobacteria bacterium]|nr:ABC transporter ATP-binding protein [Gammaproteobacteria bacterium]